MFEAYVKIDDGGNIIGYATDLSVNYDSIKVIQEDPVIDVSKLIGYKLKADDDMSYRLVFDNDKWEQAQISQEKERAFEDGKKMLEKLSYESVLAQATDEDAYVMRYLYDMWEADTEYKTGDRKRHGDNLYKCLQNHTSQAEWTPEAAPSLWAKILPGQEGTAVGEWVQPESTNPYNKGDKVTHNGKTWESLVDGNVWEPGAQGSESLWKEVIE